MTLKIAIIGAGAWGCTLANYLDRNKKGDVYLYPARAVTAEYLAQYRILPKSKDIKINQSIKIRKEFDESVAEADFVLIAVSSRYVRLTCEKLKAYTINKPVISVTKGLEEGSLKTSSEVIKEVLGKDDVSVLSGPALASEIQRGLPTELVVAKEDEKTRENIGTLLQSQQIKIVYSPYPRQIEIVASLKNLVAIVAGLSDGMHLGANFKAVLMTEMLSELHSLCNMLNVHNEVFYGIAGLGDAIATASGVNSRNYKFGYYLGSGYSVKNSRLKVGMSIEGMNLIQIIEKYRIEKNLLCPMLASLYKLICDKNANTQNFIKNFYYTE